MGHQHDEARLTASEIVAIRSKMVQKGTTEIYCQLCSEPMTPEKARKDRGGWIICRPCYMADNTDATQEEIDQAIKEDFPG